MKCVVGHSESGAFLAEPLQIKTSRLSWSSRLWFFFNHIPWSLLIPSFVRRGRGGRGLNGLCVPNACAGHGTVENFTPKTIYAQEETASISWRECSKKSVQQGRSHFDERSVHGVREHGKMARTPLAAFFNIPLMGKCHE